LDNTLLNKAEVNGGSAEFPKHSLKLSLMVANAIEEKHGGNPLPPTDVAIAIDKSPGSSDFRMLLSSSIKYGLTTGSYNSPKITLTELGRDLVEPVDEGSRSRALFQAAFRPDLFKRIFEAYKNKKVPDPQFFQNALVRDFGVSKDQVARCATIFLENVEFVGLVKLASTGKWLGAGPDLLIASADSSIRKEILVADELLSDGTEGRTAPQTGPPPGIQSSSPKNAIFVGHGKNKIPLQQLTKFLTEYHIPHKVAIEEPNRGRPISQKVAELMNECGAAIIIFTADEEFKNAAGETIYRPSENAIFELGAASALYGSRVVIFKEVGVTFPTNFRDIGYIEFEKDRLESKVNELFRELIGFGLITVSVGAVAR
jgi:Predicted nucleotide-binding protein containing TIR-like domain